MRCAQRCVCGCSVCNAIHSEIFMVIIYTMSGRTNGGIVGAKMNVLDCTRGVCCIEDYLFSIFLLDVRGAFALESRYSSQPIGMVLFAISPVIEFSLIHPEDGDLSHSFAYLSILLYIHVLAGPFRSIGISNLKRSKRR